MCCRRTLTVHAVRGSLRLRLVAFVTGVAVVCLLTPVIPMTAYATRYLVLLPHLTHGLVTTTPNPPHITTPRFGSALPFCCLHAVGAGRSVPDSRILQVWFADFGLGSSV